MNPQYKKSVMELCVLSLLRQQDRYGYEISEFLSKYIDIADGTVYPLLRKLKADGYFEEEIAARLESPACRPAVCTENQPPSAHCGTAGAGAVCRLLRAGGYIACSLSAGSLEFWRVWDWFGGGSTVGAA